MENRTSHIGRWLTLLVILLNILFNYLYTQISSTPNIQEVSRGFHDLFTPAGYVFSIWGLIYTSFIFYGVVQLLPSQRHAQIYDQLSAPLIIANILGSAWISAFTHNQILLSLVILLATLATGMLMFLRSVEAVSHQGHSRWLLVPFSLFFGWISVAMIADTAVTLISLGWNGGSQGPQFWTIMMVIIAGILALAIDGKYNNWIYSLVIVWASMGIWQERQVDYPVIATTALVSSAIILLFIIVKSLKSKVESR